MEVTGTWGSEEDNTITLNVSSLDLIGLTGFIAYMHSMSYQQNSTEFQSFHIVFVLLLVNNLLFFEPKQKNHF